jgi:hypothetical protein
MKPLEERPAGRQAGAQAVFTIASRTLHPRHATSRRVEPRIDGKS